MRRDRTAMRAALSPFRLFAIGIAVAVGVVMLIGVMSIAAPGARITPQLAPTPCPDSIACHALKRMPTSVVQP